MDRLEHMVEEDRVGLSGVGAPQDDHICLFDLLVGGRATTGTKYGRQTDDTRCVSSAVARVDVVGTNDRPGELLCRVVHLVRGPRAREHPEGARPVGLAVAPETLGGHVESLRPRCRAQNASVTDHRLSEARVLVRRCHDLLPARSNVQTSHRIYAGLSAQCLLYSKSVSTVSAWTDTRSVYCRHCSLPPHGGIVLTEAGRSGLRWDVRASWHPVQCSSPWVCSAQLPFAICGSPVAQRWARRLFSGSLRPRWRRSSSFSSAVHRSSVKPGWVPRSGGCSSAWALWSPADARPE